MRAHLEKKRRVANDKKTPTSSAFQTRRATASDVRLFGRPALDRARARRIATRSRRARDGRGVAGDDDDDDDARERRYDDGGLDARAERGAPVVVELELELDFKTRARAPNPPSRWRDRDAREEERGGERER